MPILTVQVNDAEGPANGVEVVVQLAASDRLRAGGAEVTNDPIVRHTNLAGVATFDIHGTEELVGQSLTPSGWPGPGLCRLLCRRWTGT